MANVNYDVYIRDTIDKINIILGHIDHDIGSAIKHEVELLYSDYMSYWSDNPTNADVNSELYNIHLSTYTIKAHLEAIIKDVMVLKLTDTNDIMLRQSISAPHVGTETKETPQNVCVTCNEKMMFNNITLQYTCKECGNVIEQKGTIVDERQIYSLDNYAHPVQKYTHNRTLIKWTNETLCLTNVVIPQEHYDKMTNRIIPLYGDSIGNCKRLSIVAIRNVFTTTGLTKYNPHSAWVLSYYAGEMPPRLESTEIATMHNFYYMVINFIESSPAINNRAKINKAYCPYFIYKYAQLKWADVPEKLKIIKFIHLKDPDNILKMDNIWQHVCEHFKLKFINTKITEVRTFEDV